VAGFGIGYVENSGGHLQVCVKSQNPTLLEEFSPIVIIKSITFTTD
jgi:hypothetical protein